MSDEPIIGVDARPLYYPGTGLYRYTLELLSRMTAMGGQWRLYSPRSYDRDLIAGPNIQPRSAPWATIIGGNQSSQFLFPHWLKQDQASVYWGPRHDLPLLMSSKIHTVLTVHDLTWMTCPETMPLSRRLAQRVLLPGSVRRANEIICGSHFTADEVRDKFPKIADKISVIHHASSIVTSDSENHSSRDSDYFLFVGTMEPRKNLARLLQAYKRYTSQCSKPKNLHIVGGKGWGGVDPLQLVKDNDLTDHVTVLGQIDDTVLATQYTGAYALLMPSLYEGFGLPVVEAMSFGIPSLVSATSAMSEVAANSGITVDPLSVESIASALVKLTQETELYENLSAAAQLRAKDFNWDRAAKELYGLLTLRPGG